MPFNNVGLAYVFVRLYPMLLAMRKFRLSLFGVLNILSELFTELSGDAGEASVEDENL